MKTHREFLVRRQTAKPTLDARLRVFADEYARFRRQAGRKLTVLDIGCGLHAVLAGQVDPEDTYHGCDFAPSINVRVDRYVQIDLNEESLADKLGVDSQYDVIFCGEVIEHLFSPDSLIDEIKALLHPNGIVILSTANLAYYPNRLLLLFGISPLYLENSSEVKLGRKLRALGQGNETEGHIRVFTHGAIKDLIRRKGLETQKIIPTLTWEFPPDRLVCRISRSLAPNNVFVLSLPPEATRSRHVD